MGFNLTRFKTMGRGWGRGSPPPRGSIEWVAVGDMWEPGPPPHVNPPSNAGFQVFEIGFTELDAADRWMKRLEDNIRYARQVHGDKVLSASDVDAWDALMLRWVPFRHKLTSPIRSPASIQMMLKENKAELDGLLDESKSLHDRFARKGMPMVPVPYMGEMLLVLRSLRQDPKRDPTPMDSQTNPLKPLTAAQMRAKLEAGIACGEHMLDENAAWWQWRKRDDAHGLSGAIDAARNLSNAYGKAGQSPETYRPSTPAYDEFLRRLTKIWIEAAGLYGIVETKATTVAEALDAARDGKDKAGNLLWLLLLAGAGYLGLRWLTRDKPATVVVAVPDANPAPSPPEFYY